MAVPDCLRLGTSAIITRLVSQNAASHQYKARCYFRLADVNVFAFNAYFAATSCKYRWRCAVPPAMTRDR